MVHTGDVLQGTGAMGMFWGPLEYRRILAGHLQVPASEG